MAEQSEKPVKTFSIGFEEEDFSELKYAKKVAEHIGAEHHEFIVKPNAIEILPLLVEHYGEPYADSSSIPTYYVSRETRKHVTVALNGDGGDESFAGYERYLAMRLSEKYYKIPSLLRKGLIENAVNLLPSSATKRRSKAKDLKRFVKAASLPKVERYLSLVNAIDKSSKENLYTEDFRNQVKSADSAKFLKEWFDRSNGNGIVDATMFTDQMTYLPNDLLVKVDIASMANSLEARSPLLDHKVIEFAASLPESIKLKGSENKSLLKKVGARLVPREVLYRKKMGFGVPIANWLRGELKDFLRDNLLSEKFAKRGILKQSVAEKMINEHLSGEKDNYNQLWTILMLELWFQRFID
jgi:asparagine synthase (glutamine-hydrolysing)